MTETPRYYPDNLEQSTRLRKHPRISGTFALDKSLWDGRKVGVRAITRGNYRQRTARRIYYGVLILAEGSTDQFGIRLTSGEVVLIHKNRGVDVYDLTRTLPEAGTP